jgi:hypothetical protein
VPFYAETVAHKMTELTNGQASSTVADNRSNTEFHRWRNTAAITRIAFHAPSTFNFIAGSHVIIYGR